MKIILINGSPRKDGATSKILNEMAKILEEKSGVELELIHLSDMDMKFCRGCCGCYTTGSCYINDDIDYLSQKIGKADGLIIGTPTYASNVPGQLKILIDRGHFVLEQLLYRKHAISVTTYENYGGKDASKTLNKLLSYSGSQISSKVLLKLSFSEDPLSDVKFRRLLQKKSEKLYKDISENHFYVLQKIKHFVIFNIGIKPFVKRKGDKYKGVVNHWIENGISKNPANFS